MEEDAGVYIVSIGKIKVVLSESKQRTLSVKDVGTQPITLGVRPSHITLGEGENTISAKVDVSEMMGSKVHLHANAAGRDVVVIVPTPDLSSANFTSVTAIRLHFDGNVCHLFDSQEKNWSFDIHSQRRHGSSYAGSFFNNDSDSDT